MLEFVDSDLYFVQDKNNSINPLLQVGSGSGSSEKSTGSGSGGPKITGSGSSSLVLGDVTVLICFYYDASEANFNMTRLLPESLSQHITNLLRYWSNIRFSAILLINAYCMSVTVPRNFL